MPGQSVLAYLFRLRIHPFSQVILLLKNIDFLSLLYYFLIIGILRCFFVPPFERQEMETAHVLNSTNDDDRGQSVWRMLTSEIFLVSYLVLGTLAFMAGIFIVTYAEHKASQYYECLERYGVQWSECQYPDKPVFAGFLMICGMVVIGAASLVSFYLHDTLVRGTVLDKVHDTKIINHRFSTQTKDYNYRLYVDGYTRWGERGQRMVHVSQRVYENIDIGDEYR